MTLDQLISVFKNASTQLSFVTLTSEEQERLVKLAQEVKTILDGAVERVTAKKHFT
jgi:hypothetical protein